MNLLQILQRWTNEASLTKGNVQTWRPGQVLQGEVLQLLDDRHAVIRINGMKLRARLEIPLQAGQKAYLQVQPGTSGDLIRLKPLQQSRLAMTNDSIKHLLEQAGLPMRLPFRELVVRVHEAGGVPDPKTLRALLPILEAKPDDYTVNVSNWIRSGLTAHERNYPLTRAFIEPLYQLQYGKSFEELTDTLLRQLETFIHQRKGDADNIRAMAALQQLLSESSALSSQPASANSNWLLRLFQIIGLNYENKLMRGGQSADAAESSMKPLLLRIMAADVMPHDIKTTARQLMQHITGQQLLMSAEASSDVFQAVTMVVPFFNEKGKQTASIQIQSQVKRNGQTLDPDNCRMLFDLTMARLGPVLIDAQVVQKNVMITVRNDHAQAKHVLENMHRELKPALETLGYAVAAFQIRPYSFENNGDEKAAGRLKHELAFYEGVDIRI